MLNLEQLKKIIPGYRINQLFALADKEQENARDFDREGFQVSIQLDDCSEVDAYYTYNIQFSEYELQGFLMSDD